MLETIRQFAEEQLVANGEADDARTAHARYFAGREADMSWRCGTARANARPTIGSPSSWRTSVPPSAGPPTTATSTPPPAIAVYATFLGFWVEQHEPVAWAEELIEPARIVEHRRLAQLYAMAAQCYVTGRFDDCRRCTPTPTMRPSTAGDSTKSHELSTPRSTAASSSGDPERLGRTVSGTEWHEGPDQSLFTCKLWSSR